MELYQLRTFAAVAKTKHLTQAAEQLAVSYQSACSKCANKGSGGRISFIIVCQDVQGNVINPRGKNIASVCRKGAC